MSRRLIAITLSAYLANPALRLPRRIGVNKAAATITAHLTIETGATFSLYFGEVRDQSLFAVAIYPERGVSIPIDDLTIDVLHGFISVNRDLLTDPRNCIGIWYVRKENTAYLDISTTLPNREEAIHLGQHYNQIGIYDFEQAQVINTGGTGVEIPGLPHFEQRLPMLERTMSHEDDSSDAGNDTS